jgi:hypothetical protein
VGERIGPSPQTGTVQHGCLYPVAELDESYNHWDVKYLLLVTSSSSAGSKLILPRNWILLAINAPGTFLHVQTEEARFQISWQ